jgi:hypothetical protein
MVCLCNGLAFYSVWSSVCYYILNTRLRNGTSPWPWTWRASSRIPENWNIGSLASGTKPGCHSSSAASRTRLIRCQLLDSPLGAPSVEIDPLGWSYGGRPSVRPFDLLNIRECSASYLWGNIIEKSSSKYGRILWFSKKSAQSKQKV